MTVFWCQATCWLVKCASQETISFPFSSWRTIACKLVAGTCRKTNSDCLGWNQHFHMCRKYVCMYILDGKRTDTSSMAAAPALAGCDGGCMAKTDLDVLAAQCCWLSISWCRTEDFVGKWLRASTGRKCILDLFKQEMSTAVHVNLGKYPGKELWIAESIAQREKAEWSFLFGGIKGDFWSIWKMLSCRFYFADLSVRQFAMSSDRLYLSN